VMATEEGTKKVEVGVGLAMHAQEAITQLSSVINESAQAAAQMVAGGQQQASGIGQIAFAMQSINQATLQGLSSTREADKTAHDLNELALKLNEAVAQYQV
jgi:methyl-accepting chemotaxis protein